MSLRSYRHWSLLVLLVGLTGPFAQAQTAPAVLAHWSQIVGNAASGDVLPLQVMARFVVQGQDQDCSAFALTPYAASGSPTGPTAPTTRALTPNDPAFAITVCQFVMAPDWTRATLHTTTASDPLATFPGPYGVGRRNTGELVAIGIGDTGCRASDCDAAHGTNARFLHVVAEILHDHGTPDFIVHVGDYRYYNENSRPDAWSTWAMEFFEPAQPLLNLAPIALIRGNHEECDGNEGYWYGARWYQFFEPTTSARVGSCSWGTASLHDPWYFDVALKTTEVGTAYGTDASLAHRMVMIDTSPDPANFGDFTPVADSMTAHFETVLTYPDSIDTWWIMHKPLWSYPNRYASHETQQAVFDALGASPSLCTDAQCHPRALLAGHAHMYQQVDFGAVAWPVQYVLGHSGVRPLSGADTTRSYLFTPPNGQTYRGDVALIYDQNGYLVWRRNARSVDTPSGWITENCLLNTACVRVSPMSPEEAPTRH